MKRLRGLQLVAALCVVLAAAPRTQPEPTHDQGEATTTKRIPYEVTTEIQEFAASRFPDRYAGIAVSDARSMVIVYRVPSEAFDAAIRRRFPDVRIVLANVTMSAVEMKALSTRIVSDIPYWHERGVPVTTVGPDPTGSAVRIGVNRDLRSARRQLEGHYGVDRVYVVYANPNLLTHTAGD